MIRGVARFALLRFLPRRFLPVLTAWEVLQLVREVRRSRRERAAARPAPAPTTAPVAPAARRRRPR